MDEETLALINADRNKKHALRTFKPWDSSHIVPKGETFAICGIAPVKFWDDTLDANKPVCRHCLNKASQNRIEVL